LAQRRNNCDQKPFSNERQKSSDFPAGKPAKHVIQMTMMSRPPDTASREGPFTSTVLLPGTLNPVHQTFPLKSETRQKPYFPTSIFSSQLYELRGKKYRLRDCKGRKNCHL
jgi:hypothetical protein